MQDLQTVGKSKMKNRDKNGRESLLLTTYRGGSHLPADIIIVANNTTIINDKSSNPSFWQILTDQESTAFLDCLFSRDELATESATKALHPCFP